MKSLMKFARMLTIMLVVFLIAKPQSIQAQGPLSEGIPPDQVQPPPQCMVDGPNCQEPVLPNDTGVLVLPDKCVDDGCPESSPIFEHPSNDHKKLFLCKVDGPRCVSIAFFDFLFEILDLSFFKPDQCQNDGCPDQGPMAQDPDESDGSDNGNDDSTNDDNDNGSDDDHDDSNDDSGTDSNSTDTNTDSGDDSDTETITFTEEEAEVISGKPLVNREMGQTVSAEATSTASDYKQRGVKYVMGGSAAGGGNTSDCSHFVHDALQQAGVDVPYTPTSAMPGSPYFTEVPTGEELAGDIIVQGRHMGVFNGSHNEKGNPMAEQMGKGGAREAPFGAGGWFAEPETMKFYRSRVNPKP